ncbi:MAG: hypothetical protein ABI690_11835 [Chloroflexota bacterium]
MEETNPVEPSAPEWVEQARARGLGNALSVALDVLEPLGPLGAQLLWVAQPVLGIMVSRSMLDSMAQALEEPGGIERLRQQLEAE